MSDEITFYDEIEGYCGRLSYRSGDVVALHVSTRAARYDVRVERWGRERELVWSASDLAGEYVPPPAEADASGCDWPTSVEIPVADDWRAGFYLITLTAKDGAPGRDIAHACFAVRRAATPHRAVLVLATNTWNAYNTWGGRSLYTGGDQVSFRRPFGRGMLCRDEVERDDRKARPVRWGEEPDADGSIYQAYRMAHGYPAGIGSSGWFSHERRFVEWAESAGFDFDYAVSSDLEVSTSLDGYELVCVVGHDEYWSAAQRDTVEAHVRRGGNLASFSGNTMFWQVRLVDDGDHMVCHKYAAHEVDPVVRTNPVEMTGMWCDPMVGRPEWELLGAGSAFGLYHRFGQATPRGVGGFIVYRPEHWMLADTGLGYGDVLGSDDGVVGYETVGCRIGFDEFQQPIAAAVAGMPPDVEIVGFVPSSNLADGEYPASISALSDQGDAEFVAERFFGGVTPENLARARHGNAVMLTCRPFGRDAGEVVTVGTTDWVFGLAGDPAVARVTANVVQHLLDHN